MAVALVTCTTVAITLKGGSLSSQHPHAHVFPTRRSDAAARRSLIGQHAREHEPAAAGGDGHAARAGARAVADAAASDPPDTAAGEQPGRADAPAEGDAGAVVGGKRTGPNPLQWRMVQPSEAPPNVSVTQFARAPRFKHPIWWHAPIWSGTGYSTEAINYVLSMLRSDMVAAEDLWVASHGDYPSDAVIDHMDPSDRAVLQLLESQAQLQKDANHGVPRAPTIVVCHSMPTNWAVASPTYAIPRTQQCPPDPAKWGLSYLIGRTMFEADLIPKTFVQRCNAMNEVWVPSEFSRRSFIASGVHSHKLVVVPEGVNTTLFDPDKYTPMELDKLGELVFGTPKTKGWRERQQPSPSAASLGAAGAQEQQQQQRRPSLHRRRRALSQAAAAAQGALPAVTEGNSSSSSNSSAGAGVGAAAGAGRGEGGDGADVSRQLRGLFDGSGGGAGGGGGKGGDASGRPYVFLSSFKWESRKGWDVLIEAFLTEFTDKDNVELYILTKPFMDSGDGFRSTMRAWVDARFSGGGEVAAKHTLQLLQLHQRVKVLQERQGAASAQGGELNNLVAEQGEKLKRVTGELEATRSELAALQAEVRRTATALRVQQAAGGAGGGGAALAASVAAAQQQARQRSQQQQQQHQEQQQQQQLHQQQHRHAVFGDAAPVVDAAPDDDDVAAAADEAPSRRRRRRGRALLASPRRARRQYPTLYVITQHIGDADFPRFYRSGDAFVLPSRGEGWGRPHVEAMAMGLPVIATNWSGITAYLDESVGYPLAIEGLVPVDDTSDGAEMFRGLNWAQPSVEHLRSLMRRVYTHRDEAAEKGAAARRRMSEQYSPEVLAAQVVREFRRIEAGIPDDPVPVKIKLDP